VDFSLCANRNRIPNDPVASKDRRQGTPFKDAGLDWFDILNVPDDI
jgi:hypothetical protein